MSPAVWMLSYSQLLQVISTFFEKPTWNRFNRYRSIFWTSEVSEESNSHLRIPPSLYSGDLRRIYPSFRNCNWVSRIFLCYQMLSKVEHCWTKVLQNELKPCTQLQVIPCALFDMHQSWIRVVCNWIMLCFF